MALLRRVLSAFESVAPLRLADSTWDNVGVLVEAPYPREGAKTVFLTIDLTPRVLEEALSLDNVGVIVAYHPTIFRGWKRLQLSNHLDPESYKQEMVMKLAAKGISLYCPHTSLDAAHGGRLSPLKVKTVEAIVPTEAATAEMPEGMGRLVTLDEPRDLLDLVGVIKDHLNLTHVRVGTAADSKKIQTVALCAGSGFSVVSKCKPMADLLWTGEMGHHEVLGATQLGSHVVLCEHTNTERGYLAQVLRNKLEGHGLAVTVSTVDRDPLVIQ